VRFRRGDGEYRWFLVTGVPLRDEQGKILKWYGIVTDIEDRKRAAEAQHRTEVILSQAQRIARIGVWVTRSPMIPEYPAGGGRFVATIEPCERLSTIQLLDRGEIERRCAVAIVANLPRGIAQREIDTITKLLNWDAESTQILETRNSVGPGNIVLIELTGSNVSEMFCGFGRIGASAESVASEAVDAARSYMVSGAVAGEHLADQLLLPIALAGGGAFTAEKLNLHSRTNMDIIRYFLAVEFVTNQEENFIRVDVKPVL
jgi:RNA 3'-terminal phosphate cyclase (ATP)